MRTTHWRHGHWRERSSRSVVTLSLVAAGGLALATGEGASLDLVPVIVGVLVLTMAIGALFVYERPLVAVVSMVVQASVDA